MILVCLGVSQNPDSDNIWHWSLNFGIVPTVTSRRPENRFQLQWNSCMFFCDVLSFHLYTSIGLWRPSKLQKSVKFLQCRVNSETNICDQVFQWQMFGLFGLVKNELSNEEKWSFFFLSSSVFTCLFSEDWWTIILIGVRSMLSLSLLLRTICDIRTIFSVRNTSSLSNLILLGEETIQVVFFTVVF